MKLSENITHMSINTTFESIGKKTYLNISFRTIKYPKDLSYLFESFRQISTYTSSFPFPVPLIGILAADLKLIAFKES